MDRVFLYNIPNKSVEHIHRASDWNISAPDWHGKLVVTETDSNSCQVQFKNKNGMFGVAAITKDEFSSSQVFQKVKDSSRYYTVQIQNIVSGDSTIYGMGFLGSKDMSILFHCLQDYFGSQNESFNHTDRALVKPDVADGFTKEILFIHPKKVKAPVKVEAAEDVKSNGQAPIKLDVKDETKEVKSKGQALIKLEVKEETEDAKSNGQAPIKLEVKEETEDAKSNGQAPIKSDVKEETEDVKSNRKAPIKLDVKDETEDVKSKGQAPIKLEVKEETEDVKSNGQALIKLEVKDVKYTGLAPIKEDVNSKITKDLNRITKKSKCTGRTSVTVKVTVSDKLNEPTKAGTKIGQSSEVKYSECKKIKRDTQKDNTKKSVTHQEALPLEVDIKETKTCDNPNSKEPLSKISKKRKLQRDTHRPPTGANKHPENKAKVHIKDGITRDSKCNRRTAVKVNFISCNLHEPTKVKKGVKIGKLNGIKYLEHKKIKLSTKLDVKKKNVTHQNSLPLKVNIKDAKTFETPDSKEQTTEISKKRKLQSKSQSDKDQIKSNKSSSNIGSRLWNVSNPSISVNEPKKAKRIYTCAICSTKFEIERYLQLHCEYHHKSTSEQPAENCLVDKEKSSAKEHDSTISKKGTLQIESQSGEDQVVVKKVISNIVTKEQDGTKDLHSADITDSGFLYQDSVKKYCMCHLCPYTSPFQSKMIFLLIHWASIHKIEKPNICKLCNLVFSTAELRAKHIDLRHEKMCSFCAMEFDTKTKLESHLKDQHVPFVNNPDPVSVPAIISRVAPVTPTVHNTPLSVHKKKFKSGMSYQCPRTQTIICTLCPLLQFPRKRKLAFLFKHWKEVHNIIEPHACKFCYLKFPMAAHRSKHVLALHKICPICSGEFRRVENLNKHLKSVHHLNSSNQSISVETKKAKTLSHKCLICSLEFETERHLRYHSEFHTRKILPNKEGNSSYLCNVCGRNFTCEERLEIHLIIDHDY